jgi:PilZ domain
MRIKERVMTELQKVGLGTSQISPSSSVPLTPLLLTDRRRIARVDVACTAFLEIAGSLAAAYITDVSSGGLQIEMGTAYRIAPGTPVAIIFSDLSRIEGLLHWQYETKLGIGFHAQCAEIHSFVASEHLGIDYFTHLVRWQNLRRAVPRSALPNRSASRFNGAHLSRQIRTAE